MGAGPSTGTGPSQSSQPKPRPFSALPTSGRYALLRTPAGAAVHVLGVYPGSSLSAAEASALIASVHPAAVYIDAHPELVAALEADVDAGRLTATGWRAPDKSAPFGRVGAAGWLVSLNLRNALADSEFLALLGAETFGPFKAGIAAARGVSPAPASILAFPFEMAHNNGETLSRPTELGVMLTGNASTTSTAVTAFVGNPAVWSYPASVTMPSRNSLDVERTVALPPEGYFTRAGVAALADDLSGAINRVAALATAEGSDAEADLAAREAECRERGDVTTADMLAARGHVAQNFSAAVAWSLQAWGDAEVARRASASGSPPSLELDTPRATAVTETAVVTRAQLPQQPVALVALVNIGGMASLQRNWSEPRAPHDVSPPFTTTQVFIGNALPALALAGVVYGGVRAARRFPRTTGVVTATFAFATGTLIYSTCYGDWTRYGGHVRAALARPRVISPLARVNK